MIHKTYLLVALLLLASGCRVESEKGLSEISRNPAACLQNINPESARVVEVIDGDTIIAEVNGEKVQVRYLGIDTPEMSASNVKPGEAAMNLNRTYVEGKIIELYHDVDDRDDFGRLLRYVIVDDMFLNYELIASGNATTFIRPPNNGCEIELRSAMLQAYESRIGIWKDVDELYSYSGENECIDGCEKRKSDCLIKGNINSSGDMIYHLPMEKSYNDVGINPEKGERWFCTIEEAITNGWRPQRVE